MKNQKRKKKSSRKITKVTNEKILLATAVIGLIKAIIELIEKLID